MKKKRLTSNIKSPALIIFLFLGFLAVFYIFFSNITNQYQVSRNNESRVYESEYLKFTLNLPIAYQVADETSRITLNSKKGKLTIVRNGTQFNSINEYLNDFDLKRNLEIIKDQNLKINGYDSRSRELLFSDQNIKQKSIYIYVDSWVYVLSTSSEELYDELDQIAKSFKYTGEK